MQILLVKVDFSKIPRGTIFRDTMRNIRNLKHGSVVVVPTPGMELEVIEIEGDKVDPLFIVDGDRIICVEEGQHSEGS